MKFKRLMALAMSMALAVASHPSVRVAAQAANPVGPSQQAVRGTGLAVSGTVAQRDRRTPAADTCLRLRKLDTNAIVASTVSDKTGAFSMSAPEPGMYLVEAVNCANGDVLAVSDALTLAQLPITTLVVLPTIATAAAVSSMALLVIGAASAAGITALALQSDEDTPPPNVLSPEQ